MPPKSGRSDRRKRDATANSDGGGGGDDGSNGSDCSLDVKDDSDDDDDGRRVRARRTPTGVFDRGVVDDTAHASTTVAADTIAADSIPEPPLGDRVYASIETRWVRPLVALLHDFRVAEFTLRFSDAGCTTLFMDNPHITLVCARWSSDAFCCYDVRPGDVVTSPPPPDGSSSSVPVSLPEPSSSLPPPPPSIVPPSLSDATPPPVPGVDGHDDASAIGSDDGDADVGIVKMVINVERLSELLLLPPSSSSPSSPSCSSTTGDERLTFRIDARGTCSVASSRGGAPLEWTTAAAAPSSDEPCVRESDVAHVVATTGGDLGLCGVDSSLWWSYWRDVSPGDPAVVAQTLGAVRVETKTKGSGVFRCDLATACGSSSSPSSSSSSPPPSSQSAGPGTEDPELRRVSGELKSAVGGRSTARLEIQTMPSLATASVTMSYGVVYALHPLAGYEFVATRLRIRCREDAPLRFGYDLDDVAGIAVAHTRALAHLDPSLPPVLVAVVRQYLPSRMRSSIDAFVAPLATGFR